MKALTMPDFGTLQESGPFNISDYFPFYTLAVMFAAQYKVTMTQIVDSDTTF